MRAPRLQCPTHIGSQESSTMAAPKQLDQITEKVERLLLRHEELQRTNALLVEQVHALQAERDSLKSRLLAARARIDALLERLPATEERKERS
jgi:cell division protein ZapB